MTATTWMGMDARALVRWRRGGRVRGAGACRARAILFVVMVCKWGWSRAMTTTEEITTGAARLAQWSAGGIAAGKSAQGSAGTGCAGVMSNATTATQSPTTDAARVAVWRLGIRVEALGHTGSAEGRGTSVRQDAGRARCQREHGSSVMTETQLEGMGATRDAGLSVDGIAVEGMR